MFTLLDQLAAWKEDVANGATSSNGPGATMSRDDEETLGAVRDVLRAVPRELLARAALRCGAPARALLYFEDHLRARKNVLNQAALRDGEPEGGGLDDASAAFLAATHRALRRAGRARSGRASAVAGRPGSSSETAPTGAVLSSDALAAARRRAEDALLQHEQAGEWTEAMTHYESASRRREMGVCAARAIPGPIPIPSSTRPNSGGCGVCRASATCARWRRRRRRSSRPGPRRARELADMGAAAAAWRLGRWDSLETFLDVLDANAGIGAGTEGGAAGGGGDFSGRPGGEAAVGRVLLALHRRDATGVARAATAARDR